MKHAILGKLAIFVLRVSMQCNAKNHAQDPGAGNRFAPIAKLL